MIKSSILQIAFLLPFILVPFSSPAHEYEPEVTCLTAGVSAFAGLDQVLDWEALGLESFRGIAGEIDIGVCNRGIELAIAGSERPTRSEGALGFGLTINFGWRNHRSVYGGVVREAFHTHRSLSHLFAAAVGLAVTLEDEKEYHDHPGPGKIGLGIGLGAASLDMRREHATWFSKPD